MRSATSYIFIALFICLSTFTFFAQETEAPYVKKAIKLFDNKAYNDAIPLLQKVIRKDSNNTEAIIKLADSYRLTKNTINAEYWYRKAISTKSTQSQPNIYFAQMLMMNGKYGEAEKVLEEMIIRGVDDSRVIKYLETIEHYTKYFVDTPYYNVKKLNINSTDAEFSPVIYKDGIIFTSSRPKFDMVKRNDAWTGKDFLSLYYASSNDNSEFTKPKLLFPGVESKYNDGPLTVSKDGKTMYFTRNSLEKHDENELIYLEIYESMLQPDGTHWSEQVIPFRWNSDSYNCTHPCLSPDGNFLYFASDMKLGFGGMDIYVCTREGNSWSEPHNLGPEINTKGNEVFPYVHDNGLLYFSSDGHDVLGGLDIFYAKKIDNSYATPVNMGAPINSNQDDFGIVFKGKNGYFSSNRERKGTDDDLYYFMYTKPDKFRLKLKLVDSIAFRAIENAYVRVKDVQTKKTIFSRHLDRESLSIDILPVSEYSIEVSAEKYQTKVIKRKLADNGSEILVELAPFNGIRKDGKKSWQADICIAGTAYTVNDGRKTILNNIPLAIFEQDGKTKILDVVTDAKGKYEICHLEEGKKYVTKVSSNGYFAFSNDINTSAIHSDSILFSDLVMKKIVTGKSVKVDNINFETGKWTVQADVNKEIDKLVRIMLDNPTIVIEIGSHTDCRGSMTENMSLSDKRAGVIKDYLISKGVESKRLLTLGYGESTLVNKCECEDLVTVPCTEEQHQENNRIEFKVIGYMRGGVIYSE